MSTTKPKKNPRAWESLNPPLSQWILDAVSTMGFSQMTPVQTATIPHFLGNKDVVVEAVTGSGKTLSFLIPIVERILRAEESTKRHHVNTIIVSPTRELAAQIHTVLLGLLEFHEPSAEILPALKDDDERRPMTKVPVVVPQLLVGGTTKTAQDLSFFMRHSPNLLISSPGRLVELLSSPHVHCPQSSFEMLVLDEADRLLDLGFKPDLQKILGSLPKQRRTGLFSASVSEAVGEIIRVGLRNPVKIEVKVKMKKTGDILEDRKTPASLQMSYLLKPASQKLPALAKLLQNLSVKPQRSIVFLSACASVDYFQHILPLLLPEEFAVVPLHGKHPAKVREKNFNKFLTSVSPTVLLTTDVAARGLDIPQVDLVVQIDAPSDPKVFIHRNGRAGRAGRKGLSVVMLHPGPEEDYVRFLEVRKTPIKPLERPDTTTTEADADEAAAKIRALTSTDRALYDKAQKGFVSWARSYCAHQASSIFQTTSLDWADLAKGWGLLRMPKMPELKRWEGDRTLGQEIDWDKFAYKEKLREKARLAAMEADQTEFAERKAAERKRKKKNNEAWSSKHEAEDVRVERREKRRKRKEAEIMAHMTEEEKGEKQDLEDMIRQIREKNMQKKGKKDDEFEGFDD